MNTTVHGQCDSRFDTVRELFEHNIATGEEIGAAIAVNIDGDTVIDLWGGHRDEARTTPWTTDTIVNVWSSTKTVTNLAALMLFDRGYLEFDDPVATFWPEFAANGKAHVQVRHLLAHTSGVSGWNAPFTTTDMYDWNTSVTALAAQAPWWEPGTASGYHAHNQGHLIGELVRRITGSSLKDFIRYNIAQPLGADFQIGSTPNDVGRIADIIAPPPLEIPIESLPADSPCRKTLTGPPPNAAAANTTAWRNADLGALNGHTTARALATVLSTISLGGTVNGTQLLRADSVDHIFNEQAHGTDQVLLTDITWGLGYALATPDLLPSAPPDERICFWGGWGGSLAVMCPDRRTTISYVMNKMGPGVIGSDRSHAYSAAIFSALP